MKSFFSGIGKMLTDQKAREQESEALKTASASFQVAGDGGYIVALKYLLFVLFGFYNVRLFLATVPGWEGALTACFAVLGEVTALYCFNNYKRSTGHHKTALGVFGLLLFLFSFTHATISFFKMEHGNHSAKINFYSEHVAFPLLFGLLLAAAIIIPLLHWRTKVAAKQADAQTKIETDHANLVAETAEMRNKAQLERERLTHFEEEIKLGNEYVDKLKQYARMKQSEQMALSDIPEPFRSQIASQLGIPLPAASSAESLLPATNKPVVSWRGGVRVDDTRGN